ncbi:MAG: VOC family protein [Flavobacteriales bacterium]|nr:VOC family protein [Flavobacteriales bacterium]
MNRLDHVLIRVDKLEKAVQEFQQMGFKVFYGNAKENCHHALIYFQDESFIELVDQSKFPALLLYLSKKKVLKNLGIFFSRIGHYASSESRFLDYSIYDSDIDYMHKKCKTNNKVSKLFKLKREDSKGQKLNWKLFAFKDMDLPFIMSDYSPLKYPGNDADVHPNGILGIEAMEIASTNVSAYCQKLNRIFDIESADAVFNFEHTKIRVVKGNSSKIRSLTLKGELQSDFDLESLQSYGIFMS